MGFAPEDAMVLAIRADLADAIAQVMDAGGIVGANATAKLGLPQGTVSQLKNGRVDHISIERLMRAMVRANIPGFAIWPNVEDARAGSLPATRSAGTTIAKFTVEADTNWMPNSDLWQLQPVGAQANG